MPVSMVCDSGVSAVLRDSLSRESSSRPDTSLQSQIVSATKHLVLKAIEYEEYSENFNAQTDSLKSKYIVLSENNNSTNNFSANNGRDRKATQSTNNVNTNGSTCSNESTSGSAGSNGNHSAAQKNKPNELPTPKRILFPSDRVQIGWKSGRKWQIGAGMINVGNTCYLNSTLQALFHVPAMANWLTSDSEHREQCEALSSGGQSCCIICAMSKTLISSQSNQFPIKPFLVYSKLKLVCKHLVHGRQEDAHEFLRYLIEAMEKAYLSRFKLNLDQYSKETTPLNQILGGYLRSTVRCLACGHLSVTFQHFEDLLLDIRKANTVDEALQGYFARERLEDMGYKCESCKKKVSATKQFTLERAPIVLCIQLKRFSMQGTKLNKQVTIKPKLDLSPYVKRNGNLMYRLVSMVTHLGASQHCGHYTAIGLTESGTYYQFDDSSVRSISLQNVLQTNGYIMFYELDSMSAIDGGGGSNGSLMPSLNGNARSTVTLPSTMTSNSFNEFGDRNGSGNASAVYKPKLIEDGSGDRREINGFIGPVLPPNFHKPAGGDENKMNGSSSSHPSADNFSANATVTGSNNKPVQNQYSKKYPAPDLSSMNRDKSDTKSVTTLPSMPQLNPDDNEFDVRSNKTGRLEEDKVKNSHANGGYNNNNTNNNTGRPKSLVPYDLEVTSDDDDNNEDSNIKKLDNGTTAENGKTRRPSPFVRTNSGIWKVYDTDEDEGQQAGQNGGNEEKSKFKLNTASNGTKMNGDKVVSELLKFDHRGYGGASISTWNGQRSTMEKMVHDEKRLERKREFEQSADDQEMDRGKTKKIKLASVVGRDNPGFNPFQEHQNRQRQNWMNGRAGLFRNKFKSHHRPPHNNGGGHHNNNNNHSNNNRYPYQQNRNNHNNRNHAFRGGNNHHFRKFHNSGNRGGSNNHNNGYRRSK